MTEPTEKTLAEVTQANTPWAMPAPAAADRATPRARRYVEGLPDWEPLPPGEILVQRRGHS
ncbi:hypothetical protein [Allorhizocola rhizosphaerae]|uniref:hypothetical protein n=1 Tax=Allorhizocola rhizosphaerae TaxID=1872709 RepID=UPI000E3DC325|nr:hypothetical protein [Allorhizocola rhizosphaerae]